MIEVTVDAGVLQRDEARRKANAVRSARATIKREINLRQRDVREVVFHPPAFCGGMEIEDLLIALPRVGRVLARRMILGICSPTLELSDMGDYTRNRLAHAIEERAWWALPQGRAA